MIWAKLKNYAETNKIFLDLLNASQNEFEKKLHEEQ
jgi:hypothetical protein